MRADANRGNKNSAMVLTALENLEKTSAVIQLRTGRPYGSQFGDATEQGVITIDVAAVTADAARQTTLPFVVIHEIGHVFGYWSFGNPSGHSSPSALLFENAARRGRIRIERTEHCCYPPLTRVVP